jgi:hypothetical protein
MRLGRLLPIALFAVVLLLVGLAAAGSRLPAASAQQEREVQLVAGCNPVASTHPNDTPPTTIGEGIDPADALVSIWFLLMSEGRWLGYSPAVPPQGNDLQSVDRLDAIFVCVDTDAVITMPYVAPPS